MSYVLIVEDDPYIQMMVSRKLETSGYQVRSSDSGTEALELMQQEKPLIVLLDVMLPDRSGLDVCAELKRTWADDAPPVIVVSARGGDADIVAADIAGADDYIIKPFAPNELLAHIHALLNSG